MPLSNRVTPFGDVISDPARGLVYGNRGCLHDDRQHIVRRYNGRRWIACRLRFKDRRRSPLMVPGRYTELFFLDEATAFAAGHRPCAECRREDYRRFTEIWGELHPRQTGADAMDVQLHAERVDSDTRGQRRHELPIEGLPDGALVAREGVPWVVRGDQLLAWTPAGYRERRPRPVRETAWVLTPPSLLGVLRAGWSPVVPLLHPTAGDSLSAAGWS
jgi:hypothetical protein